jgi:hypothetical protein
MDTGHFVKVFDILDAGYRSGWVPAKGLTFIAIALLVVVFPIIVRALRIPYLNLLSWRFRLSLLGFAVVWTTVAYWGTYSGYLRHRSLAQDNHCRVVEGPVEHFVTTPSRFGGLARETFSVSGVPFGYSDFDLTDGFNNTSSNGGPIDAGSYVRICYYPDSYDPPRNVILRLEIRDFTGELKDYRRNNFPWSVDSPEDNEKNPPIKTPWDVYLFYVVFIFDIVAIHAMFLPYLRTFFRVKLTPVSDCPIPSALEPGKKTKLRNSMIYWDTRDRAIWLRPRGLNLFQFPLQVAKLNIDESGISIREIEIRLSSGLPVAMILILWAVYRSASTTVSVGGPPPILIVGLFALMMLIIGALNLWLGSWPQMTILVEDALSELKGMRGPWERA